MFRHLRGLAAAARLHVERRKLMQTKRGCPSKRERTKRCVRAALSGEAFGDGGLLGQDELDDLLALDGARLDELAADLPCIVAHAARWRDAHYRDPQAQL